MTEEENWLDPAVLEYVKNNSGNIDRMDVVDHFRLRCDITLFSVQRLIDSGKIEKREIYANKHRLYLKI